VEFGSLVVDDVAAVVLVVVAASDEVDGVGVGPTVAASGNRLVLSLQQIGSPQHHSLSLHFDTTVLSFKAFFGQQLALVPLTRQLWLTSPNAQTSPKQYGLRHVGSVHPDLHHSLGVTVTSGSKAPKF
jgi:hypothetical protein